MRTEIQRSTVVKPLLALFGGTSSRSFLEFEGDALHVRFGWLFDERIPLSSIASVERARWPLIGGLGWRTNFVDTIALVGSYSNVVRIRMKPAVSVRMVTRMDCESLYISVEDPDSFVSELLQKIATGVS